MNATPQALLDDNEDEFYQTVGMFGADLTNFETHCFENYEYSDSRYKYSGGCEHGIIKYYDGLAFGSYVDVADGDQYAIYDGAETWMATDDCAHICLANNDCFGTCVSATGGYANFYPANTQNNR